MNSFLLIAIFLIGILGVYVLGFMITTVIEFSKNREYTTIEDEINEYCNTKII